MTKFHRYNLVSYLTPGNPEFLARQQAIAANMLAHGYSPAAAKSAALGMIDHSVQAQASVMAFNDGFLLLGIAFIVASPAILILRVSKAAPPPGAGH